MADAKAQPGQPVATGVSEVRLSRERTEENTARQLDEARRSESGVVKRQIHRSPGCECKLVGQGQGASLEEMPVAHEAWILVVR